MARYAQKSNRKIRQRKVICPECGSPMKLKNGKYKDMFYGCTRYPLCKASHGSHPDGKPLGIPADKKTRQARIDAHALFDKLPGTKRDRYKELKEIMGMTVQQAHIAKFDIQQCEFLITYLKEG